MIWLGRHPPPHPPPEAYDLIKAAYGDLAFSRRHTFNLLKQLKSGRVIIESQAGKSLKLTLRRGDKVAMIRNMVESNRRVTIQELVSDSRLSTGTIHLILHEDLSLSKVSARWVPPVKAKVVGSQKKIMLVAFFDVDGMVYQQYIPQGTTINSEYYCEVLRTFQRHLSDKRPEKIQNGWLLHQDNARPHTCKIHI